MGLAVPLRVAVVVCAGSLALAGCGRRGPLELPNGAPPTPQAADAELAQQQRQLQQSEQPGLIQNPNEIYEQPVKAKLDAAVKGPPPHAINAPPAPGSTATKPSGFFLNSLL